MSQVTAYRHKAKPVVAKKYASEGCPVQEGGENECGETEGLEILDDFDKLYKDKMKEVDVVAGGDNLQEKVDLQQEWIDDLTQQNKLLAKVIQELENESIARMQQLEEKLKNAVKSLGEDDKEELADKDKKIKELEDALKAAEALRKKGEENEKLKKPEEVKEPSKPISSEAGPSKKPDPEPDEVKPLKKEEKREPQEKIVEPPKETEKPKVEEEFKKEPEKKIVEPPKETEKPKVEEEVKKEPEKKIVEPPKETEKPKVEEEVKKEPEKKITEPPKETEKPKVEEVKKEEKKEPEKKIVEPPKEKEKPAIEKEAEKEGKKEPEEKITEPPKETEKPKVEDEAKKEEETQPEEPEEPPEETEKEAKEEEPEEEFVEPPKETEEPKVIEEEEEDTGVDTYSEETPIEQEEAEPTPEKEEEPKPDEKDVCQTIDKTCWMEIEKLKEENRKLREEEIQKLKDDIDEKMKRILELNQENQELNDIINKLKGDQSFKLTRKEREEYEFLKKRVKTLEQETGDSENITANLQTAVDLYVSTIQLLGSSEQRLKTEVEQYRFMNQVMQENVVSLEQQIETIKQQFQQEIEELMWQNFMHLIDIADIEHTNKLYHQQINHHQNLHQRLLELNYELEVEHVNVLQDFSMLELQLNKYQSLMKTIQEDKTVIKTELRKLSKKNKCYEEVVQFFKEEMSVMSDELLTLQQVLNVTNVSSQEENTKLITAILQLRRINDRLVDHLCQIEKQMVFENQLNQISEARINELQNIIGSKNNDLNQHDEIIKDMRKKLNNVTNQNTDLKKTIKNLTDTVVQIQEGIKAVELDHRKNCKDVSRAESRVCLASGNLEDIQECMDRKNNKILDLENQLKSQEVAVVLATKELEMLEQKKWDSKEMINTLKNQLMNSERKNKQIIGDFQMVSKKLEEYASIEQLKNFEIEHYRCLVDEMKSSMIQLNAGLEKCEASNIHFFDDFISCCSIKNKGEVEMTQKKSNLSTVFEEMKKSMTEMKRKLTETNIKTELFQQNLLRVRESHRSDIQEEVTENHKLFDCIIKLSAEEQVMVAQLVKQQREQIEMLKEQLQDVQQKFGHREQSIDQNSQSRAFETEMTHLKSEFHNSLQRQNSLNEENEKLHNQMLNLRKKLTKAEHGYEILKQECEEYKAQMKMALREKEYLARNNSELKKTIEDMRSNHDHLEKQYRYSSDCIRNLQLELSEAQTERDELSSEAQNLIRVVHLWLSEQNTVNGEIRGKFQNYKDTITSLKATMRKRMSEDQNSWVKTPMQQPFSSRQYGGTTTRWDRQEPTATRHRRSDRRAADASYIDPSPWRDLDEYLEKELLADEFLDAPNNCIMKNIYYDSQSSPYSSRSQSPQSRSFPEEELEDDVKFDDWLSPYYKETDTDNDDEESFTGNKPRLVALRHVEEANQKWRDRRSIDGYSSGCQSKSS